MNNLYDASFNKAWIMYGVAKHTLTEKDMATYFFTEGAYAEKKVQSIKSKVCLIENDELLLSFYSRSVN